MLPILQHKFTVLIKEHESRLKKDNLIFNIIGYVKLFLVLIILFIIYLMVFKTFSSERLIVFGVSLISLVIFWVYHNKLHDNINYQRGIISICNKQIDRITGKWTEFEDVGEEFIDINHAYACDIDVVGKKSLFQLLNTTNTWHGRQALASDLLHSSYKHDELQERQNAVVELSCDIKFASKMQYYFSKIGVDSSAAKLVNELKDNTPFIKNRIIRIFLTYVPALTLIFIAVVFIFQQKNLYLVAALISAVQTIIWIAGALRTQKYLGIMASLPYKLSAYSDVIDILINKDFSSEKLKQIKEQLNTALQAVKDLSRIADKISVKHNGIIYCILNIFLLWDYECAFLLEKWKNKYSHLSEQWFLTIGEFESLLSLSHLPNICNNTCLPDIIEKSKMIESKEMGHPLLLNDIRVNNDFYFSDNIYIISGSNMSGKTTFLRTVGINLVLANSGGRKGTNLPKTRYR